MTNYCKDKECYLYDKAEHYHLTNDIVRFTKPDDEFCSNCGEKLTDIEKESKHKSQETEWCCSECFECSDEEYTEHGKYIMVIKFLKAVVNRKIYSLAVSMDNARHAEELLKHIGEM